MFLFWDVASTTEWWNFAGQLALLACHSTPLLCRPLSALQVSVVFCYLGWHPPLTQCQNTFSFLKGIPWNILLFSYETTSASWTRSCTLYFEFSETLSWQAGSPRPIRVSHKCHISAFSKYWDQASQLSCTSPKNKYHYYSKWSL